MLEGSLAAGDRALVFTQYAVMGGMLQEHLREALEVEARLPTGATRRKARDIMGTGCPGKAEGPRQVAKSAGVGITRFDMSESMERTTVSRLLGAPPGYVGFDQGGLLTDAIDQHPHCVLLLDEIEKAHPDLFNILLQVMDHGKLTDHNGKQVDFRNVILIMTTNAGASELSKQAYGFTRTKREGDDQEAINRMFAPEFRNRLDAPPPSPPPSHAAPAPALATLVPPPHLSAPPGPTRCPAGARAPAPRPPASELRSLTALPPIPRAWQSRSTSAVGIVQSREWWVCMWRSSFTALSLAVTSRRLAGCKLS